MIVWSTLTALEVSHFINIFCYQFDFQFSSSSGCDGCLNWDGVGFRYPDAAQIRNKFLYEDIRSTNNNGLEYTVAVLEEIYTNPTFPPKAPALSQSLRDSGKSRLESIAMHSVPVLILFRRWSAQNECRILYFSFWYNESNSTLSFRGPTCGPTLPRLPWSSVWSRTTTSVRTVL